MSYSIAQALDLLTLFILVGTFLGISLGMMLLYLKPERNLSNRFLALLLIGFTMYMLPGFLDRFGLLHQLPHFVEIHFLFDFMIGPLIFLYVSACTKEGFKMEGKLWLHFIPAIIDWFWHIPFILLGGDEKLQIYMASQPSNLEAVFSIHDFISAIHALVYYVFSCKLVLAYKKHVLNSTSYIDNVFHRWLFLLCSALLLPIFVILLFVLSGFEIASATFIIFGFFFFIVTIYVYALLKPEVFHRYPNQIAIIAPELQQKKKYENSTLSELQKEKLTKKLVDFVSTEKPYQEPELSLSQLSEQVKIPTHYLSQIINEKLGCNFLDFINAYRIKETKEKLIHPDYAHLTILAIAFEAGFNSKTAFYTAFKKQVGITPSKFRKK